MTVESLDEFLKLDYQMKITPFKEDDEKGYIVTCPELSGLEVYGDTVKEALEEVNEAKTALYHMYRKLGTSIYYPSNPIENRPSGRLTARLPVNLHKKIKLYAENNNVSLNAALVQLLNDGFRVVELSTISEELEHIKKTLNRETNVNITYQNRNRNVHIPYSMEKMSRYEHLPRSIKTKYTFDNSLIN